jgi:hypothetical protein
MAWYNGTTVQWYNNITVHWYTDSTVQIYSNTNLQRLNGELQTNQLSEEIAELPWLKAS